MIKHVITNSKRRVNFFHVYAVIKLAGCQLLQLLACRAGRK